MTFNAAEKTRELMLTPESTCLSRQFAQISFRQLNNGALPSRFVTQMGPPATVAWKTLGTVLVAFLLGVIACLVWISTSNNSGAEFSVPALLGFTLSVILAGASIVLAISAIGLGRASEAALMHRSDESIRMQNEVFVKTTEALQRIESSTGVTEKRIEDMIAGRVGDISHDVAKRASKRGLGSRKNLEGLEETVRDSLLQNLTVRNDPKMLARLHEKRRREELEEDRYQHGHHSLLAKISEQDGVEAVKAGHGDPADSGHDAFDAIFQRAKARIAVSTLRPEAHPRFAESLITGAISEFEQTQLDKLFIVFFSEHQPDGRLKKVREFLKMIRPDLSSKIHLESGDYDSVSEIAQRLVAEI